MKQKKMIPWLITALYILWIWSNSFAQGTDSGNLSTKVALYVLSIVEKTGFTIEFDLFHHYIRKLAHFSEYFLMAFLVFLSQRTRRLPHAPTSLWVLVPVIDETIQHFIPGRNGAYSDVLLDMCGYAAGYLCAYILFLIYQDIKQRLKKPV